MIDFRAGFGYDSHRLETGRKLMIGGVEIPHSKGAIAHSDGDALLHAICDALLGAAGFEDIGSQFPDNDPKYRNINSLILLQKTNDLLKKEQWNINNIDATVILEQPKLAPFKENIKNKIAQILNIEPSRVAIKAKTNEKMDAIGAGNAIAAYTAVTIIRNINP